MKMDGQRVYFERARQPTISIARAMMDTKLPVPKLTAGMLSSYREWLRRYTAIASMNYWLGKSKVERDIYDASKLNKEYDAAAAQGGARDILEYFFSTALEAGLVDDFLQSLNGPPPFLRIIQQLSKGRRFCITAKGRMGLVLDSANEGDDICILCGGLAPFVVRQVHHGYSTVGEAYIRGVMYGETMNDNDLILGGTPLV